LTKNASNARDTVVDTASGVAAAAGLAFAPREDRRESRPRRDYDREDRPRRDYDREDRRPGGFGERNEWGIARGARDSSRTMLSVTPSPSLYVGNLVFEVTEADLEKEFEQFGRISSVRVAVDGRGLSKGFAYISFEDQSAATAALEAKNETVFEGRRMIVNYQIKNQRPQTANPPSKTLFIGNLAFEMSDADLNKLFKDIKNVIDVRVAIDRRTGQPRGFAHADFVDQESAMKAVETLQGQEIYG
jgi:RNA recognition motif-containing protein